MISQLEDATSRSVEQTGAISPEAAWDEAFLRVESYLRAHHLESRMRLNELATGIIREAREKSRTRPGEPPVTTALRVTHERIGQWFGQAGLSGDWSDERTRVRGRIAWLRANSRANPADAFLGPQPAALGEALAAGTLRAGPELRFTNMPPAPLAFGFDPQRDPGWGRISRVELVKAACVWLGIVVFYGVAWAASR